MKITQQRSPNALIGKISPCDDTQFKNKYIANVSCAFRFSVAKTHECTKIKIMSFRLLKSKVSSNKFIAWKDL